MFKTITDCFGLRVVAAPKRPRSDLDRRAAFGAQRKRELNCVCQGVVGASVGRRPTQRSVSLAVRVGPRAFSARAHRKPSASAATSRTVRSRRERRSSSSRTFTLLAARWIRRLRMEVRGRGRQRVEQRDRGADRQREVRAENGYEHCHQIRRETGRVAA